MKKIKLSGVLNLIIKTYYSAEMFPPDNAFCWPCCIQQPQILIQM